MYKFFLYFLIAALLSCSGNKRPDVNQPVPVKKKSPRELRTKPLLVLDAGHGGRDPGGVNDSLKLLEKNITRNIVDALIAEIDTNKISVFQTRPGDESTHRHERIKTVNPMEPDLLLTVHVNSYSVDSSHNGFEVIYNDSLLKEIRKTDSTFINYANPFKKELHKYASIMEKNVRKAIPKMRSRGVLVRKDDIWMIYAVNYPSILFEFGFITNLEDALIMREKKEIKKLAVALKNSLYEILGVG